MAEKVALAIRQNLGAWCAYSATAKKTEKNIDTCWIKQITNAKNSTTNTQENSKKHHDPEKYSKRTTWFTCRIFIMFDDIQLN